MEDWIVIWYVSERVVQRYVCAFLARGKRLPVFVDVEMRSFLTTPSIWLSSFERFNFFFLCLIQHELTLANCSTYLHSDIHTFSYTHIVHCSKLSSNSHALNTDYTFNIHVRPVGWCWHWCVTQSVVVHKAIVHVSTTSWNVNRYVRRSKIVCVCVGEG